MKKASITEAKNTFSALIDRVKAGASILIVERGRPVARLEPVTGGLGGVEGRLAQLVRAGVVRPPRGPVPRSIFSTAPPKPKRGVSIVDILIDERREGR